MAGIVIIVWPYWEKLRTLCNQSLLFISCQDNDYLQWVILVIFTRKIGCVPSWFSPFVYFLVVQVMIPGPHTCSWQKRHMKQIIKTNMHTWRVGLSKGGRWSSARNDVRELTIYNFKKKTRKRKEILQHIIYKNPFGLGGYLSKRKVRNLCSTRIRQYLDNGDGNKHLYRWKSTQV
jgi:hypothetical protein